MGLQILDGVERIMASQSTNFDVLHMDGLALATR